MVHAICPCAPATATICTEAADEPLFHADSHLKPGHSSTLIHTLVQVRFRPADCRACPSRARCTRAAPTRGRYLTLYPRPEHEVLVAARARERTAEYRRLYAQRQGIESTMSQGVRAFGLRRARYRGLAKTGLQTFATAAAINLDRIAAWLAKRPLAPTRTSRFAALAA